MLQWVLIHEINAKFKGTVSPAVSPSVCRYDTRNKFILNLLPVIYLLIIYCFYRSQWPRVLRRRSGATRLLRSWVWIPPGAWMFVCCGCCVLSGRGLCDELITRPEEFYRLWCVVVCDLEKPQAWGGHDPRWVATPQYIYIYIYYYCCCCCCCYLNLISIHVAPT